MSHQIIDNVSILPTFAFSVVTLTKIKFTVIGLVFFFSHLVCNRSQLCIYIVGLHCLSNKFHLVQLLKCSSIPIFVFLETGGSLAFTYAIPVQYLNIVPGAYFPQFGHPLVYGL